MMQREKPFLLALQKARVGVRLSGGRRGLGHGAMHIKVAPSVAAVG